MEPGIVPAPAPTVLPGRVENGFPVVVEVEVPGMVEKELPVVALPGDSGVELCSGGRLAAPTPRGFPGTVLPPSGMLPNGVGLLTPRLLEGNPGESPGVPSTVFPGVSDPGTSGVVVTPGAVESPGVKVVPRWVA